MEARALKKYIRSSPVKMRLVIDMIRGKKISDAIGILHFSPKSAARVAEQTLRSAVSNLSNKKKEAGESGREDNFFVSQAFVDVGPTMKRVMPAPMGRAFRVRKRSNHLTIIVSDGEVSEEKIENIKE
ncbi:MAG: 50S ribosomal protein L22 [Ignavibacteria bacterium GWF2_33_9]|nr:MAG: 50S ribosomal protein L22 [Ignavibacteria bacterium GWF2_33_9]